MLRVCGDDGDAVESDYNYYRSRQGCECAEGGQDEEMVAKITKCRHLSMYVVCVCVCVCIGGWVECSVQH